MKQLRNISPIWIALAGVWVAVVIIFVVIMFVSDEQQPPRQLTPTVPSGQADELSGVEKAEMWPANTIELSARGDTYSVYSDNPQEPRILEIAFDPLKPEPGEDQAVIVRMREKGDTITRDNTVTAEMITDAGSEMVDLALKKVEEPDLSTTWRGVWTFEAPSTELLQAKITGRNSANTNSVTVSFK